MCSSHNRSFFFFFNDTATTEIYTLSLHDALPIYQPLDPGIEVVEALAMHVRSGQEGVALLAHNGHELIDRAGAVLDRKSTRLNSSHSQISYAVFCLKKKN